VREPRKVRDVSPVYPAIARTARIQGVVILEAVINERGVVERVKVLGSVPLLDNAAIDAVKEWRYTPTLLNGVPVSVLMTITINFKLND
jgi:protein TonB